MTGEQIMENDGIVVYSRNGDVGLVEMNRPPHNLLEETLLAGLSEAFARAVDEGCRSILLSSRLRHFCAGADLDAMASGGLGRLDLIGWLRAVEDLPVPTVAAVHGAALGGGFEVALACDLIIAAESAQIGLVETTLGLFPLMGGVSRAVAGAGPARAKELVMLGRRHTPATLERWGLVNQVVADDALAEASLSLARQLAAGPTVAYRAVKRIANETAAHGVFAGDEVTGEVAPAVWASSDLKAGLDAFFATGTADGVFSGS
jgi:enoyl-CoA hydratase/carnithine racemase